MTEHHEKDDRHARIKPALQLLLLMKERDREEYRVNRLHIHGQSRCECAQMPLCDQR
jgi:hypothetical protein